MEKEKLSFFKKLKISIFDFDGYHDLAAEKISRTIGYIVLLMLIFSIVISLAYTFKFNQIINGIANYIDTEISEISYENYNVNIVPKNEEEITKIDGDSLDATIIINTQTDEEQKINKTIDDIKSQKNGILILKDRIIIKNEIMNDTIEYSFKDLFETYNINEISKTEVLNYLNRK